MGLIGHMSFHVFHVFRASDSYVVVCYICMDIRVLCPVNLWPVSSEFGTVQEALERGL